MKESLLNIRTLVLLSVFTILLSSCESNFKDIQLINKVSFYPSGEAENMLLHYTDSGRVKAILKSEKMLDFQQVRYPFTEFPNGIHLTFLDQQGQKNYVESDYAISYTATDLIDLRGNVVITTHDGNVLEADQLFFDQRNDWIYTEGRYKISDIDNSFTQGVGLDSDGSFKTIKAKNSYAESIKKD